MEPKHIIITGGHSGIGLELTKRLIAEGHKLGLIIRSEKRKNETIHAIGDAENIDFFFADLSKKSEITKVVDSIKSAWPKIDGLFNNAGVLLDKAYYSERGNEMQFEINTLSVYSLTEQLKPLLEKGKNPFVVNTATGGMHAQKSLNIENLKKPKKFVKLIGSYMYSKFAMILMMNHLAKEFPQIRVVHVDPGPNKTNMSSGAGMPAWLKPIRNLFFSEPTKGAGKLYDGAFGKAFQNQNGIYITGGKVKAIKLEITNKEIDELRGYTMVSKKN